MGSAQKNRNQKIRHTALHRAQSKVAKKNASIMLAFFRGIFDPDNNFCP